MNPWLTHGFSALCLVIGIIQAVGGRMDDWLAPFGRWWRRRRHKNTLHHPDPVQAALDEHVAVMTPNAGIAVAIVTVSGARYWFAGHIDGNLTKAPDTGTPFEIGSITKTFTTSLLVAMESEGLVRLDTPLDDLLPPDRRPGKQEPAPVTLENLATHTSGLPRLPWGWPMLAGIYFSPRQPYRFISHAVLKRWLRHRHIRHVGHYRYSNLGYGVLGNMLAERAGSTYDEALQRFVLRPLRLEHTHTGNTADARHEVAQPHTALGRRIPAWNLRALAGAGAIHSTLTDMTRWLQANLAMAAPLDTRLHESRINRGRQHHGVALGWHVDGAGERRVVWHNGGTGGSRSLAAFAPARGTGIVVLSNCAVSVDALGLRLLRQVNSKPPGNGSPEHMQHLPDGNSDAT